LTPARIPQIVRALPRPSARLKGQRDAPGTAVAAAWLVLGIVIAPAYGSRVPDLLGKLAAISRYLRFIGKAYIFE
jgi:hypothetical protein